MVARLKARKPGDPAVIKPPQRIRRSRPGGPDSSSGRASGRPEAPSTEAASPRRDVCSPQTMVCFHPHTARWVSDGGWVEVCGECSECRTPSLERWPPAHRTVTVEGGRLCFRGSRKAYGQTLTVLYRAVPLA